MELAGGLTFTREKQQAMFARQRLIRVSQGLAT